MTTGVMDAPATPAAGVPDGLYAVLTPAAAAAYLRVPEAALIAEAEGGRVPGRKIGGEWRFLKLALADWLNGGPPRPPVSSRERLLALAGVWKDDPTVDAMIEVIDRDRKRRPGGG